jgi:putative DNA primase/helicase
LLAKYWPREGGRHNAALAIGGVMARSGISSGRAAQLVEATANAANDNQCRDRKTAARDAAEAYAAGKNTFGFSQLREIFGESVARRVCEWLGYHDSNIGLFRVATDDAPLQPSQASLQPMPAEAPEFTDEFMALRFAEHHADDLRYVASRGQWMHYDGVRWRQDETLMAMDQVRELCRATASSITEPKVAKPLTSATKVAAVVTLARSDRRLAASNDQWDGDPMLLNTPSGVLDLETGELRSHSPGDYMTKVTAVSPGGGCPMWQQHLLRIMNGDAAMVSYLQRVFGYGLTGLTREHALFFGHGTGANGKGVTFNTVAGIMSGYHKTAPIETFTASHTDRHPTELAGLQGARVVTANETEEGRGWAEARIKSLTGGDPVAARYMRQDFFEYTPQFKLLIAGNHKPALRSVDEAIRRRFNLIPFTVTIPPEDRDGTLTERLKSEWPGILAWMVQGCLQWQREGLNPPQTVRDATAEFWRQRMR